MGLFGFGKKSKKIRACDVIGVWYRKQKRRNDVIRAYRELYGRLMMENLLIEQMAQQTENILAMERVRKGFLSDLERIVSVQSWIRRDFGWKETEARILEMFKESEVKETPKTETRTKEYPLRRFPTLKELKKNFNKIKWEYQEIYFKRRLSPVLYYAPNKQCELTLKQIEVLTRMKAKREHKRKAIENNRFNHVLRYSNRFSVPKGKDVIKHMESRVNAMIKGYVVRFKLHRKIRSTILIQRWWRRWRNAPEDEKKYFKPKDIQQRILQWYHDVLESSKANREILEAGSELNQSLEEFDSFLVDSPKSSNPGVRASDDEELTDSKRGSIQSSIRGSIESPNRGSIASPNHDSIESPNHESIESPKRESVESPKRESIESPKRESIEPSLDSPMVEIESPQMRNSKHHIDPDKGEQ